MTQRKVSTTDYHTGGEPFRIVSGGVKPLPGATILDKRRYASEHLDEIRKLLVFEPRGHADMYGCFVTEPVDDDGDIGVVFFHNAGYSTACGHGTIALVTWAIESGIIAIAGDKTSVVVDTPSGRLETVAHIDDGRVRSVRFTNVPSFVHSEGVVVPTGAGELTLDISYGGAFYASVYAPDVGLSVQPSDLPALIELGREIKLAIEKEHEVEHPVEPELRDIYGVIFYERDDAPGDLSQRNVTIFADGEVDRSPCGSGTSARLALLDRSGELQRGRTLVHRSIVNSVFHARVSDDARVAGIPAVITEVEGSAHICGFHHFVLDPADPLGTGFLLR
ncbi:MAG TPA: proline racemase family protein [Actinomycetota bacterium]|nr:proline racemase family protein [Actinomycetota bacterium]